MRQDKREVDQLRPLNIIINYTKNAAGSCLIEMGNTRVICTASIEESVPPFLRGQGKGWVTAEYAMLPASTGQRKQRDGIKKDGRSVEIQRLIGRSLRQAIDLNLLGERTIYLDCDVLDADGGTRTASITGAFIALVLAIDKLITEGKLDLSPIVGQVAAVSAGIVSQTPCLDLCYIEDSKAQVDMNAVMNEKGEFIELQGTGEGRAYTKSEWDILLDYAQKGIEALMAAQREALGEKARHIAPKPKLVVATGNAHKLHEFNVILGKHFDLIDMKSAGFDGDIDETGATFKENAMIKAQMVAKATGMCALADDSGLTVKALNGAPGVFSARYAGDHGDDQANNILLLKNLESAEDRAASFVCAIALACPEGNTINMISVEASCEGKIGFEPIGDNGFGYDPLFIYDFESGEKTFAQASESEKNKVSHRYLATQKVLAAIEGAKSNPQKSE